MVLIKSNENFPGVHLMMNIFFIYINQNWDIDIFKMDPEMSELLCMAIVSICKILMMQNQNLNVHLGEKE